MRTFKKQTKVIVRLDYTNGSVIETTREHPFYVAGAGWTPAEELQSGMLLTQARTSPSAVYLDLVSQERSDQPAVIKSVTVVERSETVYNFEVAEAHTYYVGTDEVLVHNRCFLDGTEAEKAEFMAMLQKISSDELQVDSETGEVKIVSKGDGTDRPLGTKMLREIIDDEDYKVKLQMGDGGSRVDYQERSWYSRLLPSLFSDYDSVVTMDSADREQEYILGHFDDDQLSVDKLPFVHLFGHELIHVWRDLNNYERIDSKELVEVPVAAEAAKRTRYHLTVEEALNTGLEVPGYDPWRINERKLIEEQEGKKYRLDYAPWCATPAECLE